LPIKDNVRKKRLGPGVMFFLLGNGSAIRGSKSDMWDEMSAIISILSASLFSKLLD